MSAGLAVMDGIDRAPVPLDALLPARSSRREEGSGEGAGQDRASRRSFCLMSLAVLACVDAHAAGTELAAAMRAFAGDAPVKPGRVKLDVAPLVENGNTVPLTVSVDSPMTAADHVREIAVFNEKNPQHDTVRFTLGPRAGRAVVGTRIRLATSQRLVALARMADGSVWSHSVDVVVTLAACIEA